MLAYRYDPNALDIQETVNGDDTEFMIRIPDGSPHLEAFKRIMKYFEDNEEITDAFFYTYPHHEYRVIVRRDHYANFLTQMLRYRLLQSLEWKS